jgi:ribosomal protein S18 acetylase RimI-like enzyme
VLIEPVGEPGEWRDRLADLLLEAVAGGASLGFVEPFDPAAAREWWDGVFATGSTAVLVAHEDGALLGTVSLALATPANGSHRAEVKKMVVRQASRRAGIGTALLVAVEGLARERGRSLLVLDTVRESVAAALYRRVGYVEVGSIPAYARNTKGDVLEATTIFYKLLD